MSQQQNEQNIIFSEYLNTYTTILERIYRKTIKQANDTVYAKNYFIECLENELEFHKGIYFNSSVIEYFNVFYKMGFLWDKFAKEMKRLKYIHSYKSLDEDIVQYSQMHLDFSLKEIWRIEMECQLLNKPKEEKTIYDFVNSSLLVKTRTVDFIKYVAKYRALCNFLNDLVEQKENNVCENSMNKSLSTLPIRWSTLKGRKVDLIRLLIALHDCKYFETNEGLVPTQEQVIQYFGETFFINLQHYEQDLSNGFESKLQTNISIFEKLKCAIEKRFQQKIESN